MSKLRILLLVPVLLVRVWAAPALDDARIAEIERIVAEAIRSEGVPAISVAIGLDNELRWEQGFGLSDVENKVPAKAETLYRTASIAKTMTAVAVMQLAEQGKLSIDAPIERYVPVFPEKEWPVTARHLLGHLAGVRHYKGEEFASVRHYSDLITPLDVFKDDPLLSEPGERFSYTTYGYNLLGAAVEGASGEDFVDYLKARVWAPSGLEHTAVDDVFAILDNRARGYRMSPEGELQNCGLADTSVKIPGGGLVSSAGDLVRYAGALNAGRLVSQATLAEMFTAQRLKDGTQGPVGLGWFVVLEEDGVKRVGHGGGQQGTSTNLTLYPGEGFALAVMTNLESYEGLQALVKKIIAVVRDE